MAWTITKTESRNTPTKKYPCATQTIYQHEIQSTIISDRMHTQKSLEGHIFRLLPINPTLHTM